MIAMGRITTWLNPGTPWTPQGRDLGSTRKIETKRLKYLLIVNFLNSFYDVGANLKQSFDIHSSPIGTTINSYSGQNSGLYGPFQQNFDISAKHTFWRNWFGVFL